MRARIASGPPSAPLRYICNWTSPPPSSAKDFQETSDGSIAKRCVSITSSFFWDGHLASPLPGRESISLIEGLLHVQLASQEFHHCPRIHWHSSPSYQPTRLLKHEDTPMSEERGNPLKYSRTLATT